MQCILCKCDTTANGSINGGHRFGCPGSVEGELHNRLMGNWLLGFSHSTLGVGPHSSDRSYMLGHQYQQDTASAVPPVWTGSRDSAFAA
jgi:hypothetical protein